MRRRGKALGVGGFVGCMLFAFTVAGASEWQTATPQSLGLDPQPLQRLGEAIGRGEFPKTTSVLIVYRNRLIYEGYFADGGAEVLNDTRSATKSVTARAVGAAIRDGKISAVSAPAMQFLAELAPMRNDTALKREITVEDLLTMSSALDCNDDVDASPGNEERMYEQQRWTRWPSICRPSRIISATPPAVGHFPIARRARFCWARSLSAPRACLSIGTLSKVFSSLWGSQSGSGRARRRERS